MDQNEIKWDKLLRIRTTGRDDSRADTFNYPYEPTPYSVLERLAGSGYIGKREGLLDYGCGKGRVGFFMAAQTGCRSIGVEYDERLYQKCLENQKTAASGGRCDFVCEDAGGFEVPTDVRHCFFFNPFSVEVLRKVLPRIRDSYYAQPRPMQLYFYYPSDDYVAELMQCDDLMFTDEIDCSDLFEGTNPRERILIFEIMA